MSPSIRRTGSISELLEPAIEGPPSPETLRAISNQMRLASTMNKHQSHHSHKSHQTTSSGSSSLRSLTSGERPSWDNKTFDSSSASLSRKSSGPDIPYEKGMPTSSPMPSIPPSSSHGLSSSSSKEALIPSFFNRRRAATKSVQVGEELDGQRRPQISGPYNFQHLTHTQKEQLPNLQRGSRVALQSEFVMAQSLAAPADGSLSGIQAESIQFPNFSSEALSVNEEAVSPTAPRRYQMRPHASSVSSVYPSRPLSQSRSQDQLRGPPPRPPRSPMETPSFFPPIPPPRLSSRASIQSSSDTDSMTSPKTQRPRTSGDNRHSKPAAYPIPDMPRPPLMHAHSYSADMNLSYKMDTRRFSQMPDVIIDPSVAASTIPDDSNWPLAAAPSASTTTFDILPGVPEEEEQVLNPQTSMHKSRMSVASNASSLRKSLSLPMLQQFPQPGQSSTAQRPPSAASDTLGGFDFMAAQRSMREAVYLDDDDAVDSLAKANWEDDIDYCYEHEIEADCEYAWDRSSIDLSREDALAGVIAITGHDFDFSGRAARRNSKIIMGNAPSPHMLSPGCFDVPALSPTSQTSAASINEALTPTSLAMRRPSGLTIQTGALEDELRPMHRFFHGRSGSRASRASSFKESHGFNLSPSLFIPGTDNYDQFRPPVRAPVGFAIGADEEDEYSSYIEPTMGMDKSAHFYPARASTSTTTSHRSRDSVLSDRHISANSTATDLTRLTMSTASIEDLMHNKDQEVSQI
ncbi:MAG: hypothetical protein STHCBS139747_000143 [Sporothrix thermara]